MQGDFSQAKFDPTLHTRGIEEPALGPLRNVSGVLQQQGRVITDADLAEGELLDLAWQGQAGRDIIGAGVCAVPADGSDGFAVRTAAVDGNRVIVTVDPGHAWVDGILARLVGAAAAPSQPLKREAAYFGPPWSTPLPTTASIGDDIRDAVVLELSEESLHAFQYPEQLLESALGGVDTAERAYVNCRLRLLRLADGETCSSVATRLRDDPDAKGRLSVSLQPPLVIPGDCPTVAGGGYTGFEHHLYRIEIAEQNVGAPARFKWSAWNGGLVGRGRFDATPNPDRVVIDAGRAAIVHSGLTEFYLEALQYDELRGGWKLVYATMATLNADHDLELAAPASFGTLPASADPVFFRLWNGLADISDFTDSVTPNELRDGIRLQFDAPASGNYRPGDYWTFNVRAGDIANPQVLVDDAPPVGILYHRVALAEIHWTAQRDTNLSGSIEDCRLRFRPLINQKICCTFLVGNGVTSFGDFNSLEQAAAHLPAGGGELCLLPGVHRANLLLKGRQRVKIHGCRWRTLVLPRDAQRQQPLLRIVDCTSVEIGDLDLVTFDAVAVQIENSGPRGEACRDIHIHDCRMIARRNAIRAERVEELHIAGNRLHLLDTRDGLATVSLLASDALVERNTLVLLPFVDATPDEPEQPSDDPTLDPADPCARPEIIYGFPVLVLGYVTAVWTAVLAEIVPKQPYRALGGIHLRAGCQRVRVSENRIVGGAGDGILLGGDIDPAPAPSAVDKPAPPAVVVTAPAAPAAAGVSGDGEFVALLQGEDDVALQGVDLYLQDTHSVATDRSDDEGMASIKTAPGSYRLTATPGYRIVRVMEGLQEQRRVHVVTLGREDYVVAPSQRWLHEITLHANDIAQMGLSGIGFGLRRGATLKRQPPAAASDPRDTLLAMIDEALADLALTPLLNASNPVRDLVISDNRLHHNLRNPFDATLREQAQVLGRGGISLGMAESVVIRANAIQANGVSAVDPVCGIFVGWGNDMEIVDNTLADNGAVDERYERDRRAGIRGGIYIAFAAVQSSTLSNSSGRKPALRVHDNRIDQPAGRALTAYAFGPVSVANNHFNSEYSGLFGIADAFVGGVLVFNFGGMHRLLVRLLGAFVGRTFGVKVGNGKGKRAAAPFRTLAEAGLPGGETLFNDNYVRLGLPNRGIVSQVVASLDDLGYASNTGAVYRGDRFFSNALVFGDSVRATSSRLREDISHGLSVLSWGVRMNMTALNQGDHCIVALPAATSTSLPTVDFPNQVLDRDFCRQQLSTPEQLWDFLVWVLSAQTDLLGGELGSNSFSLAEREQLPQKYLGASLKKVQQNKSALMQSHQQEAASLIEIHGNNYPAAEALAVEVDADATNVHLIGQGAETFGNVLPTAAASGATLSGRLVNDRGQGLRRATIELTRRNGSLVEAVAITDANGYFSASYDPEQTRRLEREGDLFLRAVDARGNEILRDTVALRFAADAQLRITLTVPVPLVPRAGVVGAQPIFGGPRPPSLRTPLSRLEIDDKLQERLIAAGIRDVEGVLEATNAVLARVAGSEAAAKELLLRARRVLQNNPVAPVTPAPRPTAAAADASAADTRVNDASVDDASAGAADERVSAADAAAPPAPKGTKGKGRKTGAATRKPPKKKKDP